MATLKDEMNPKVVRALFALPRAEWDTLYWRWQIKRSELLLGRYNLASVIDGMLRNSWEQEEDVSQTYSAQETLGHVGSWMKSKESAALLEELYHEWQNKHS